MARLEILQREREGYVRRGLTDRVAQVDAAIKALGGKPDVAREADPEIETPEAVPATVERAVKGKRR